MIFEPVIEEFPFHAAVPRTPGIHVSDLIRRVAVRTFGLTDSAPDDAVESARRFMEFEKGLLWEDALSLAFGSRLASRPGELELDGIMGTPDGVAVLAGILTVEEYKATTYSSSKTPADFWTWMAQCKAYCFMVGAPVAILRILHLRGDYRAAPWPAYRVWRIEYSDLELLDNWDMLLAERDMLLAEKEAQ